MLAYFNSCQCEEEVPVKAVLGVVRVVVGHPQRHKSSKAEDEEGKS